MKYRSMIIWVLFLLLCWTMRAQTGMRIRANGAILPKEYLYLVGGDLNIRQHGETTRFLLADSSYIDVYYYEPGDSILLIRTQCAPLCSSFARIYKDDWSLIRAIPTPRNMVLPEAYVENGVLLWRENFREDESPK